jgi:hypothetical protein
MLNSKIKCKDKNWFLAISSNYKPFCSWSKLNKEPFDMNWVTNIKSGKLIHAPITGKTLAELNILDFFLQKQHQITSKDKIKY